MRARPLARSVAAGFCLLLLSQAVPAAAQSVTGDPASALKRDVLCRGLDHGQEKLRSHRIWCEGYARGVIEALAGGADGIRPGCVPADPRELWTVFGEWLVAHPDQRARPAIQVMRAALAQRC